MTPFQLAHVPAINAGANALEQLTDLLSTESIQHILVVIDPGVQGAGLEPKILAPIQSTQKAIIVSALPPGEPREAFIQETRAKVTDPLHTAVVCVGGGSALDAGKLIANLLPSEKPVSDFRLANEPLPENRPLLICVPTTSGTGSEATCVAVVAEDDGVKNWFWGPGLKPNHIVLDPTLTCGLPPFVTAITGVDALVHAMEAATNKNAFSANNLYCYEAIRLVSENLRTAIGEPDNLTARGNMQLAATLAGIGIDNAGTAIAHNIAHALGSIAHIPHGLAVAMGMAATLEWNIEANPSAYKGVASAMGLNSVDELPKAFKTLVSDVKIDLTVSHEGLTNETLAAVMQQPENIAMANANLRTVEENDFFTIAQWVLDA
ncbi:iron-containing alcohol dehydrogenase [Marinibactrum halimedae]|uniref:Alcohol dehydrogenase n=1 Tax=Marinibactrum halimedae TaxID=1444977 RepID=A0AA37T2B6_9GAMM|nr:iron-containing alcohol dehydrogenase [Marinibactrum halimedae]MCD9458155.1 iron-containing alcohol dehydrogenase [Marinibactrum halimedae]GLS25088.1 alcohol dehydrogenase [Marinibactrum halimedae]